MLILLACHDQMTCSLSCSSPPPPPPHPHHAPLILSKVIRGGGCYTTFTLVRLVGHLAMALFT